MMIEDSEPHSDEEDQRDRSMKKMKMDEGTQKKSNANTNPVIQTDKSVAVLNIQEEQMILQQESIINKTKSYKSMLVDVNGVENDDSSEKEEN